MKYKYNIMEEINIIVFINDNCYVIQSMCRTYILLFQGGHGQGNLELMQVTKGRPGQDVVVDIMVSMRPALNRSVRSG